MGARFFDASSWLACAFSVLYMGRVRGGSTFNKSPWKINYIDQKKSSTSLQESLNVCLSYIPQFANWITAVSTIFSLSFTILESGVQKNPGPSLNHQHCSSWSLRMWQEDMTFPYSPLGQQELKGLCYHPRLSLKECLVPLAEWGFSVEPRGGSGTSWMVQGCFLSQASIQVLLNLWSH